MKASSGKSPISLKTLGEKRQALWELFEDRSPLLPGSVYDVLRRCGNPTCHCAKKPSHLQTLLIYAKKGVRRCKFVRQQDVEWVRQAWERYRKCKKAIKEIRAIQKREVQILVAKIKERGIFYE